MARKFRMKVGLQGALSLPGLPGLRPGVVVEGDEYARFCPSILEEVRGAAPPPPPPAPAVSPKLVEAPEDDDPEAPEAPEELPDMSWRKSDLVEYAEGVGLEVTGLTKAEILNEIELWRG